MQELKLNDAMLSVIFGGNMSGATLSRLAEGLIVYGAPPACSVAGLSLGISYSACQYVYHNWLPEILNLDVLDNFFNIPASLVIPSSAGIGFGMGLSMSMYYIFLM